MRASRVAALAFHVCHARTRAAASVTTTMSDIRAFLGADASTSGAKRTRPASSAAAAGAPDAKRAASAAAMPDVLPESSAAALGMPSAAEIAAEESKIGDAAAAATLALKELGIDVHSSWAPIVLEESKKPYFKTVVATVEAARKKTTVYPRPEHVYSALALTPLDNIRCVILGQDPYHGPGQAHGLAFSVQRGVTVPASLRNIVTEVYADCGFDKATSPVKHGNLEHWARQGVLLLNAALTVEQGDPQSHEKIGWEKLTDAIVQAVSRRCTDVVFLLWGGSAQKKASLIDKSRHIILTAPHPSPLSAHRGFFGCKHFTKTNAFLISKGYAPIDWHLDPPVGGMPVAGMPVGGMPMMAVGAMPVGAMPVGAMPYLGAMGVVPGSGAIGGASSSSAAGGAASGSAMLG